MLNRGHRLCPDVLAVLLNEGAGSVVHDLVVGRVGVITGGAWAARGKGGVFTHTISTDNVNFGVDSFLPTAETTIVLGYKKTTTTPAASGAVGTNNASSHFGVFLPYSDGTIYWDYGNFAGAGRLSIASLAFSAYDVWVFTAGSRGMEIWRNGVLITSTTSHDVYVPSGASFYLGKSGTVNSDLADYSFCYVYSRQLAPAACQAISAEPYAPILSAPYRRWFSAAIAAVPDPSPWAVPPNQPYVPKIEVYSY